MIDNFYGKFLEGLAKLIDLILTGIISLLDLVENVLGTVLNFAKILLVSLLFFGPIIFLLAGATGITFFFTIWVILLLGRQLNKFLKYFKYMVTEYLYDKADNKLKNKARKFNTMGEYGKEYWRLKEEEEEAARRRAWEAHERMRREQERAQEEAFRRFFGGNYNTNQGGNEGPFYPPFNSSFKEEYEKNCDILGVPYNGTKEDIRSAYRKKAKEYHPDLNKSEGATEMFQKINDANEFLNDENIERYKKLG